MKALVIISAVIGILPCYVHCQATSVATDALRICVVERNPFSFCEISAPENWAPSYLVNLFSDMVNGLDPDIKSKIRTDWQCVGKTTDDLVAELSRPQNSRSCDIVISPITIRDDRKALINFVSGVYYTYTLPLGPAIEQSDGSDISFWLRPFQTTAWLVNLGLYVAFYYDQTYDHTKTTILTSFLKCIMQAVGFGCHWWPLGSLFDFFLPSR